MIATKARKHYRRQIKRTKKMIKNMTEEHERILAFVIHDAPTTAENVSAQIGRSTLGVKIALSQLQARGYVAAHEGIYAPTGKGLAYEVGTGRPDGKIPKLKTDKKTGEALITKKERVLALLSEGSMSVSQISELTGAAQSYIRGVRERSAKEMEMPKTGTTKREIYDMLRKGASLATVATTCHVTIAYAYQVKQRMISAKII